MLIVCGLLFKVLPSTFVPDEDQGYFVGAVLLPEGTSLNRTSMTTDKVAATLFVSMYPWAERTEFEKSAAYAIYNVFMVGNTER